MSEVALQIMAFKNLYRRLLQISSDWDLREWIPVSIAIQILAALFIQLVWWLWPQSESPPPTIQLSTDMSFVEFQAPREAVARTKDLSDEVLEVDQLKDDRKVNWKNAVDPSMDFNQRYVASLEIRNANAEYPDSATGSNLGTIEVDVKLYIDKNSRIRDVRIIRLRSPGNAHKAFEKDFRAAARRVILKRTRLRNQPYKDGGQARDFIWETTVKFSMQ